MKTIIQILIAALVVNASARAGQAAWRYYEFKDTVQQEALHGTQATTSELHQRVLEIAAERDIPLEYGDVVVERRGEHTYVSAAYLEPIPLVPAVYTRDHQFEFELSVRAVRPLTIDDLR